MAEKRYQFTATAAARTDIRLRAGLCGAGGSGKSYSALAIGCALAQRLKLGHVFVIDSENASALRYAPSQKAGRGFAFMHVPMPTDDYSPESYCRALDYCESQGAGVIVIDSISHEYDGPGGILEIVDDEAERASKSGRARDNFSGWKVATPRHKRFLQRLNSVKAHLIFTVRAKTAYEMRDDPKRPGKQSFQKVGLGPVQREGIEYEPDLFGWMVDSTLTIDKTRVDTLDPQSVWSRPGADVAGRLADWIEDVVPTAPKVVTLPTPPPAAERLERWKGRIAAAASDADLTAIVEELRSAEHKAPKLIEAALGVAEARRLSLVDQGAA